VAKEKWTIFYSVQPYDQTVPSWKEKEVLVEGKQEESASYNAEALSGMLNGRIQECNMLTLEAASEGEAYSALKKVLGPAQACGPALAIKSSSLGRVT
jgi:hypothetical protein